MSKSNRNFKSSWSESSCFKFNQQSNAWESFDLSTQTVNNVDILSILSQNVLFDEFETDKIYSAYRWPEMLNQIQLLNADVIGFQEVTLPFLTILLECSWIRSQYYISDINGKHTTPYGQVIVSKYPFKSSYYEYSSQKRVIVGTFKFNDRTVNIPVVHLTSDHGKGNLGQKRTLQMKALYDKFAPNDDIVDPKSTSDCFIIGDFNMTDGGEGEASALRPDFYDSFRVINGQSDPGYTFDPSRNGLAAITTKTNLSRRYDRILVRSPGMHWQALSCSLVHEDEIPITVSPPEVPESERVVVKIHPSDHFGIFGVFQFLTDDAERQQLMNKRIEVLKDNSLGTLDLETLLKSENMLPTDAQNAEYQAAIKQVQTLIHSMGITPDGFKIYTLGSYNLGIHSPGSDLDLLIVSTVPVANFLVEVATALKQLVRQHQKAKKRSDSPTSSSRPSSNTDSPMISDVRLVTEAIVPIVALKIGNIEVELQYCQLLSDKQRPINLKNNSNFNFPRMLEEASIRSDIKAQFEPISYMIAQGYRSMEILRNQVIPKLRIFHLALLVIRRWANAQGLNSNRIGFLGGHAWAIMLARVAQEHPSASPAELVLFFFKTYSAWDFRTSPICVNLNPPISYHMVSKKEPICILTCAAPYKNITRNATHSARRILVLALQKAALTLTTQSLSAKASITQLWEPVDFFSSHSSYLQVIVSAASKHEYLTWVNHVESRLVQLLLMLETHSVVLAHPWPTRMISESRFHTFCGSYWIGLSVIKENLRKENSQSLDLVPNIQAFIESVENWPRKTADMNLTIKQRQKGTIKPQSPETEQTYSEYVDEMSEDEEDSEEESSGSEEQGTPTSKTSNQQSLLTKNNNKSLPTSTLALLAADKSEDQGKKTDSKQSKKDKKRSEAATSSQVEQKRRMRTSEECMSWIRHDPRFNPEEFIVVYEDRFVGLMEVRLSDFTSDQQSEVFIPQHRIWYIKHGENIVWDRKNRLDILDSLLN